MTTAHRYSNIHHLTMYHFLGLTWSWYLSSLTWPSLSGLLYLGLWFSKQSAIYYQYYMKLQWYLTIHHVQNQPNLCWVNLAKSLINPYMNPWVTFKGFYICLWNLGSKRYIYQTCIISYIPYCISWIWL